MKNSPADRAPVRVLVLLCAAMAMGPIFNYAIGTLGASILHELGITEGQYGVIVAVVFLSAAASSSALGALSDRIPQRVQFVTIFGGVALAFAISTLGFGYGGLIVAAIVAGLCQAFSNPVTNRYIATQVPGWQRSSWMGWKQSGVQMAMLGSGLIFPPLAAAGGWLYAALGGMGISILGVVVSLLLLRSDTRRAVKKAAATAAPDATASPTGPIVTPQQLRPFTWGYTAASFLNAFGFQATNAYLALFAVHQLGATEQLAGVMIAVTGAAGIGFRILWGRWSGRIDRPGQLITLFSLGGIVAALAFEGAGVWHQWWLLVVALLMHASTVLATNVVINSGLVGMVPRQSIGLASGFVSTGMYLGFALGPLTFGFLVDLSGGYTAGWWAVLIAYAFSALAGLWLVRSRQRLQAAR